MQYDEGFGANFEDFSGETTVTLTPNPDNIGSQLTDANEVLAMIVKIPERKKKVEQHVSETEMTRNLKVEQHVLETEMPKALNTNPLQENVDFDRFRGF